MGLVRASYIRIIRYIKRAPAVLVSRPAPVATPATPPAMPAVALPPVAPFTARPALDAGGPYGSPYAPLEREPGRPRPTRRPTRRPAPVPSRSAALTAEGEAWVAHATAHGMTERAAVRKALQAVGLSVRYRANALAIPSKLVGVKAHQATVARLARHADRLDRGGLGLRLHAVATADEDRAVSVEVSVELGGDRLALGAVQDKHAAWLAPLLAHGATVCLSAVTGRQRGRTMGVNVVFGFAAQAIANARASAEAAADDVELRRGRDGETEVVFGSDRRFHRAVYDWGRRGAGPSRLALDVLRRFAGEAEAQRLRPAFVDDVVAAVPRAGGTIAAADVRAWVADNAPGGDRP